MFLEQHWLLSVLGQLCLMVWYVALGDWEMLKIISLVLHEQNNRRHTEPMVSCYQRRMNCHSSYLRSHESHVATSVCLNGNEGKFQTPPTVCQAGAKICDQEARAVTMARLIYK